MVGGVVRCSGGVSGDQWWSQRVGWHWGVLCTGAAQIEKAWAVKSGRVLK